MMGVLRHVQRVQDQKLENERHGAFLVVCLTSRH